MSETLDQLAKGDLPPTEVKKVDDTPEVLERVLRFTTREMGFDIEQPKTREDVVVAIGIKDMNPERVLKYCQYMKVDQVSTSFLGKMTGISTIGQKRISCVKFGYGLDGFALDHISESFRQQHCEACLSRKPRNASWKWSFEWEKNKAHEYESVAKT
jgi:hypothetical protein